MALWTSSPWRSTNRLGCCSIGVGWKKVLVNSTTSAFKYSTVNLKDKVELKKASLSDCKFLFVLGPPGRGSLPPSPCYSSEDVISCQLTRSVQCAHQKPITVLKAAAGRVVTGSQDHTVRVKDHTNAYLVKIIYTRSLHVEKIGDSAT